MEYIESLRLLSDLIIYELSDIVYLMHALADVANALCRVEPACCPDSTIFMETAKVATAKIEETIATQYALDVILAALRAA